MRGSVHVIGDETAPPTISFGGTGDVRNSYIDADSWFGAADAHGHNGFKPNRIHGVTCFLINDGPDQWKFANSDDGLWIHTRRDLLRKALDRDPCPATLGELSDSLHDLSEHQSLDCGEVLTAVRRKCPAESNVRLTDLVEAQRG